ncbi:hypothetical protein ACFQ6V_13035 [Streptomyces roseifaciens]
MAQTKLDKQVEETAEALMFGIGRFLAGRDMDGIRRTDATFFRAGHWVLPKVEGRVSRSSYRAGWQRLLFRISLLGTTGEGSYLLGWHPDATVQSAQDLWEHQDATVQTLQIGGIDAAAGGLAYGFLTRERRELMREWVAPLHQALAVPLGIAEQHAPAATSTSRATSPTTTRRYAST